MGPPVQLMLAAMQAWGQLKYNCCIVVLDLYIVMRWFVELHAMNGQYTTSFLYGRPAESVALQLPDLHACRASMLSCGLAAFVDCMQKID